MMKLEITIPDSGAPTVRVVEGGQQVAGRTAADQPAASTPEQQRSDNLRRDNERLQAEHFSGTSGVNARDLTPEELVYMRHAMDYARHRFAQHGKSSPDIWRALLVGSHAEMNAAISGSQDRTDVQPVRAAFMADQAKWVEDFSARSPRLPQAFHSWLNRELTK